MPAAEPPRTLDDLLDNARVLGSEYKHYDAPTAAERIARALARREHPAAGSGAAPPLPAAPTAGAEHEQARHELDLAAALVLSTPQATAALVRLVDDPRIDPDGALVFACLLHLTGREHAARFWWQFAASGGDATSAYCLYLDHRRHAEYHDADYWRRQAAELRTARRAIPVFAPVHRPLLPDNVLRDVLAQCHHGRHPQLPAQLEAVINQVAILKTDAGSAERSQYPLPAHPVPALDGCAQRDRRTTRHPHRSGPVSAAAASAASPAAAPTSSGMLKP